VDRCDRGRQYAGKCERVPVAGKMVTLPVRLRPRRMGRTGSGPGLCYPKASKQAEAAEKFACGPLRKIILSWSRRTLAGLEFRPERESRPTTILNMQSRLSLRLRSKQCKARPDESCIKKVPYTGISLWHPGISIVRRSSRPEYFGCVGG